jgi:signal transduction histidine kinase
LLNRFQADIDAVGRIASVPAILDTICRTTGMRLAAVARVAGDHWVAMKVHDSIGSGLFSGGEFNIDAALRNAADRQPAALAIDDVAADERFNRDMVSGFRSFISAPIVLGDGSPFGALCAMDPQPARVDNPQTIATVELFAELIARQLDAGRALAATEQRLMEERVAQELRERFIAILGHDLRNPLASIQAGTKRIARLSDDGQIGMTLSLMQRSIDRMMNLIDNVMDFVRQPGSGPELVRNADEPLEPVFVRIIDEFRVGWPERQIDVDFRLSHPVTADRARIGRLFANLIDNALTHGSDESAIRVHASAENRQFVLWVANAGLPIPADRFDRLFKPFSRDDVQGKPGLGLGLYVAAEIARAHGGELSVSSTPEETRFTFRMPIGNHDG